MDFRSLYEMFDEENAENNKHSEVMILGDGVSYDLDTHKKQLNNNVIVAGSPGNGKTRGIVIDTETGKYDKISV